MILSILLNYTDPHNIGPSEPKETIAKTQGKFLKSGKIGLGAFLQPHLVPPVFRTKSKFLYGSVYISRV